MKKILLLLFCFCINNSMDSASNNEKLEAEINKKIEAGMKNNLSLWWKYFKKNIHKLRIEIEKFDNNSDLVFSLIKSTGSINVEAYFTESKNITGYVRFDIPEDSIEAFKRSENKKLCDFENLKKNITLSQKSQNEENCLLYILSLINKKTLFDTSAKNTSYIFSLIKTSNLPIVKTSNLPIVKIKSLDEFIKNQEKILLEQQELPTKKRESPSKTRTQSLTESPSKNRRQSFDEVDKKFLDNSFINKKHPKGSSDNALDVKKEAQEKSALESKENTQEKSDSEHSEKSIQNISEKLTKDNGSGKIKISIEPLNCPEDHCLTVEFKNMENNNEQIITRQTEALQKLENVFNKQVGRNDLKESLEKLKKTSLNRKKPWSFWNKLFVATLLAGVGYIGFKNNQKIVNLFKKK